MFRPVEYWVVSVNVCRFACSWWKMILRRLFVFHISLRTKDFQKQRVANYVKTTCETQSIIYFEPIFKINIFCKHYFLNCGLCWWICVKNRYLVFYFWRSETKDVIRCQSGTINTMFRPIEYLVFSADVRELALTCWTMILSCLFVSIFH